MLISSFATDRLQESIRNRHESYCDGLFLSARWFVFSQLASEGTHLVVLPTRETAEYCAADLYNLIEGDRIFYLPDSGKYVEKSNYKSSLAVQRTAAIGKIMEVKDKDLLVIVSYPEALEEGVMEEGKIRESVLRFRRERSGREVSFSGKDGAEPAKTFSLYRQ